MDNTTPNTFKRKPEWLKIRLANGKNHKTIRQIVENNKLHTICQSGNCPNLNECWGAGTATFMILGEICTRSCRFCATKTGKPVAVDHEEPEKIAQSVKTMKLKHAVITSVDRDDLDDGGASVWYQTIMAIRKHNPNTTIEVLLPDFRGSKADLYTVLDARPHIAAHNLETVERLTPLVRSAARYKTSLEVIRWMKEAGMRTKSGIMVGLGETFEEVIQTLDDLVNAGCQMLTIGQYLQPTIKHLPVEEYIHPDVFYQYKEEALRRGFINVESNPLVRSSYHADNQLKS